MDNIKKLNEQLSGKSPEDIMQWAFNHSKNPILTTNFRPYEVAILYLCSKIMPDLKVVWCDSGYNTRATYVYAEKIIGDLSLNIQLYTPRHTSAHRAIFMGDVPNIDDPRHGEFTEQVKLEPFRRAMNEIKPDLWITNLRKGQTVFRDGLDILSKGQDDLLKISPFYYWTDRELDSYMEKLNLFNEYDYFDPTKADEKRECGLHNREGK
jgi:phosphoadenosine phosphosulfate reductase